MAPVIKVFYLYWFFIFCQKKISSVLSRHLDLPGVIVISPLPHILYAITVFLEFLGCQSVREGGNPFMTFLSLGFMLILSL